MFEEVVFQHTKLDDYPLLNFADTPVDPLSGAVEARKADLLGFLNDANVFVECIRDCVAVSTVLRLLCELVDGKHVVILSRVTLGSTMVAEQAFREALLRQAREYERLRTFGVKGTEMGCGGSASVHLW